MDAQELVRGGKDFEGFWARLARETLLLVKPSPGAGRVEPPFSVYDGELIRLLTIALTDT